MSVAEKFEVIADEVYNKGIKDAKLTFWNAITNNGTRANAQYMFREMDLTGFEFPKPIKISGVNSTAQYIFYYYRGEALPRKEDIDLSELRINAGTTTYMFSDCVNVTNIPDYGLPCAMSHSYSFQRCGQLKRIEAVRCNEYTTFSSSFLGCSSLEEITFAPYEKDGQTVNSVIGQNISFVDSPNLTLDTLNHIIDCLSETSTAVLTLNENSKTIIGTEGEARIRAKGWEMM